MNWLTSISLFFLLLLQAAMPNMDLCCEWKKLPALFEHYREHAAHEGTSFTAFISLHYGKGRADQHHEDEHDGRLPFQSQQHQCCHSCVFIVPMQGLTEVAALCPTTQVRDNFYSLFISSEFLESPFQPPKV